MRQRRTERHAETEAETDCDEPVTELKWVGPFSYTNYNIYYNGMCACFPALCC